MALENTGQEIPGCRLGKTAMRRTKNLPSYLLNSFEHRRNVLYPFSSHVHLTCRPNSVPPWLESWKLLRDMATSRAGPTDCRLISFREFQLSERQLPAHRLLTREL